MATQTPLHFEVEESIDQNRLPVTTIKVQGRLVSGNAKEIKDRVKPLIDAGGRHIVIDCAGLESLDSSGLGTLVGLKVSAINKGLVKLELANLSPRIAALLKLTNLADLLTT